MPKNSMAIHGIPKSQGVYSDYGVDGEGRYYPYKTQQKRNLAGDLYPATAWSAPNCNWSWPVIISREFDDAAWSETDWSQDTGEKIHVQVVEEQFYETGAALINPQQELPSWTGSSWPENVWWRELQHIDGKLSAFGGQTLGVTLKHPLSPVWSESAWSGFYPLRYGGVVNFAHSGLVAESLRSGRHWDGKCWPEAVWGSLEFLALPGSVWPETFWVEDAWSRGPINLRGVFESGQIAELSSLAAATPNRWPPERWPGESWDASLHILEGSAFTCQQGQNASVAAPEDWSATWPRASWLAHPWRCAGHISGHDVKFFAGSEILGVAFKRPENPVGLPCGLPGQAHAVLTDGPRMRKVAPAFQALFTGCGKTSAAARGLAFQVETVARITPQVNPGPGAWCPGTAHAGLVDVDGAAQALPWADSVWPEAPWSVNLGVAASAVCFTSDIMLAATGKHHLDPVWQNYEWDTAPWWYPRKQEEQ